MREIIPANRDAELRAREILSEARDQVFRECGIRENRTCVTLERFVSRAWPLICVLLVLVSCPRSLIVACSLAIVYRSIVIVFSQRFNTRGELGFFPLLRPFPLCTRFLSAFLSLFSAVSPG